VFIELGELAKLARSQPVSPNTSRQTVGQRVGPASLRVGEADLLARQAAHLAGSKFYYFQFIWSILGPKLGPKLRLH